MFVRRRSHVTHHTSHVTRHTSNVTRHTSNVTNLSPSHIVSVVSSRVSCPAIRIMLTARNHNHERNTNARQHKHTNKQAHKQTRTQAHKQTHKHTNTQTHKHTNTQTHLLPLTMRNHWRLWVQLQPQWSTVKHLVSWHGTTRTQLQWGEVT